jgi:hypothetical protein
VVSLSRRPIITPDPDSPSPPWKAQSHSMPNYFCKISAFAFYEHGKF